MKQLRNLRLGIRLGVVFAALGAALLIVLLVGLNALGGLNQRTDTLGHKDIPAVKALGSIQFAMVAYRADQLAHAHQTEDAGRKDQESQMVEHDGIMAKAFREYK